MSLSTRSPMWIGVSTPRSLLRAVLTALSQGRVSEAVVSFDDHLTCPCRCGAHRLQELRTDEFAIGLITTTKSRLCGSLWLPPSWTGLSTKQPLCAV
jgi:hypothetical protein